VPRRYPIPEGVSIIDIRPTYFEPIFLEDRVTLKPDQEAAWEVFKDCEEGILNLACGRGKTVLAIKKAVRRGGPILVLVDNVGIMKQWADEIRAFTGYEGKIGVVKSKVEQWDAPIVLASLRTVLNRPNLPPEITHKFSTVIFDEAHHLAATLLKTTLPRFWGHRMGLTATIEREDHLEPIIYQHIGPVVHSDLTQPLTPKVFFKVTPTVISMHDRRVKDCMGAFNAPNMVTSLCKDEPRNDLIVKIMQQAASAGRKILCLSHKPVHVEKLKSKVPDSAVIHGKTDSDDRLEIVKQNAVTFATLGVAAEALNVPAIDTIVFTTPFKAWRFIQQGMGRALRPVQGKKQTIIVVMYDTGVHAAAAMCRRLMEKLRARSMDYEILR
jgi:superfamily II DNA or RNA helicase